MKFRILDTNNDWSFGRGIQSYASDLQALMLNLKTRILSWVGDCFFNLSDGIDWKNLLNYNTQTQLKNAIKMMAFRTDGVLRVIDISIVVSERNATVTLNVDTIYGSNILNVINATI